MGLMNLLTVGRSLSEARNQPHRYKLTSGSLPTFGNPAGPGLEKNFEVGAPVVRERSEARPDVRKVETQPMKTDTNVIEAGPAPSRAGWVAKVNPFKSVKAAAPRRIVQGELSLDKVKPVRNDLSDSDLELVTAARRTEPAVSAERLEAVQSPVMKRSSLRERVVGLFRRRQ